MSSILGKYWELSPTGDDIEVTEERFGKTAYPAVLLPTSSYVEIILHNFPNIEIEDAARGYNITKTFPDGRKLTLSANIKDVLQLLRKMLTFTSYEDVKISRLEKENAELKKYAEALREERNSLKRENEAWKNEFKRYEEIAEKFYVGLSNALGINERGGAGSRKKVREVLSELLDSIGYELDEDDGYDYYFA